MVKTPKLQFIDSRLATLMDVASAMVVQDRSRFGHVLETFVYGKLLKHATSADGGYQLLFYSDHDQVEVAMWSWKTQRANWLGWRSRQRLLPTSGFARPQTTGERCWRPVQARGDSLGKRRFIRVDARRSNWDGLQGGFCSKYRDICKKTNAADRPIRVIARRDE